MRDLATAAQDGPAAHDLADRTAPHPLAGVTVIHGSGPLTPLFCIAPGGGGAAGYRALANALNPKQPVYLLQPLTAVPGEAADLSVPHLAMRCIAAIQHVVPDGSCSLMGGVLGGTIAFEVASRLRASGARIMSLALIEAQAPGYCNALHRRLMSGAHQLSLQAASRWARFATPTRQDIRPGHGRVHARRLMQALQAYRPEHLYEGDLLLFRAMEDAASPFAEPYNGWQRFITGRVRIQPVRTTHEHLLREPHVTTIAEKFARSHSELIHASRRPQALLSRNPMVKPA